MRKEIDLGNGIRLSESDSMGIIMHFQTKSGKASGNLIGKHDFEYLWAVEILELVSWIDESKQ